MKQAVKIHKKTGEYVEVLADIYGALAVHRRLEGPDWVLTHVPTGGQVCSFKYKKTAVMTAQQLIGLADWSGVVMPCYLTSNDDSGGLKAWQKKAILKILTEVTECK